MTKKAMLILFLTAVLAVPSSLLQAQSLYQQQEREREEQQREEQEREREQQREEQQREAEQEREQQREEQQREAEQEREQQREEQQREAEQERQAEQRQQQMQEEQQERQAEQQREEQQREAEQERQAQQQREEQQREAEQERQAEQQRQQQMQEERERRAEEQRQQQIQQEQERQKAAAENSSSAPEPNIKPVRHSAPKPAVGESVVVGVTNPALGGSVVHTSSPAFAQPAVSGPVVVSPNAVSPNAVANLNSGGATVLFVPGAPSAAPAPTGVAAAQAQVQAAQAGCAQADAYQNYVNGVVQNQNATNQQISQLMQTIADNTSDPNLQNALLNSAGQPNPINDALQQQLQGMANSYESVCQTRLANAQAALAQAQSQAGGTTSAQAAGGSSSAQPAVQSASMTNPQQASVASAGGAASQSGGAAAQSSTTATQSSSAAQPCAPVAPSGLPSPQSSWGPWTTLGNTGLVFDLSRVNGNTLTWRFLNAGSNTITAMQFNYTYIDANSGQQTTQSDILPYTLAPGQAVGGWAAYTANTQNNSLEISITQISCH